MAQFISKKDVTISQVSKKFPHSNMKNFTDDYQKVGFSFSWEINER